jgi:hypothetical protein
MNIIRYTDEFFSMEKDLDLFSKRIEGMQWWDPIRHDVFYFIYHRLSGAKIVQPPKKSILRRALHLALRRWMAAKLRLRLMFFTCDVLVLRAARHLSADGGSFDIALDEILECVKGRKLVIDTFPNYYHIRLPKKCRHQYESSKLASLNEAILARFGQSIDVESLANLRFAQYREALVQYGSLLDRAKPKYVVLVQNGVEKALFQAAHDRSIPVIEAQHGLINYVHPLYSYPTEIGIGGLATLPTIFLAFSQHWVGQCYYPVVQSVAVGNSQLFIEPGQLDRQDIMIISANIYENAIEEMLRPVAHALSMHHFFYKLHPNQFAYQSEIKKRLSDLPNVDVVADEQSFRQLMQHCSTALCIQSTGVYEALQAGLSVYLLAKLDFETHTDVLDHPNVRVVQNYEEFVCKFSSQILNTNTSRPPVFFQKFSAITTKKVMDGLCK